MVAPIGRLKHASALACALHIFGLRSDKGQASNVNLKTCPTSLSSLRPSLLDASESLFDAGRRGVVPLFRESPARKAFRRCYAALRDICHPRF